MNSEMKKINVVDIECIEHQKENIQPIRAGRSAYQLTQLFQPTRNNRLATSSHDHFDPVKLTQQRKETHAKFQHDIKVLEDALNSKTITDPHDKLIANRLIHDPLDIYLQYIRWTIESYPSGGTTAESNLIPLLEQVTRKFMSHERYHQDVRYLKCWLFYSDQIKTSTIQDQPNPNGIKNQTLTNNHSSKLILNFLIHNRIGTTFSLLYLEYFKLFLPLERLKSNPVDLSKVEQVVKFGVSQITPDDLSSDQVVKLLDQLEMIKLEMKGQEEQSGGQKDHSKTQSKSRTMMNSKKLPKKIKVFEDHGDHDGKGKSKEKQEDELDIPETDNQPIDTEDQSLSPFPLITKWDNLGTVASNKKQNTLNPTAWKGQKLPMKLAHSSRTSNPSQSSLTSNSLIMTTSIRSTKIKVFEDSFSDEGSSVEKRDPRFAEDGPTQVDETTLKSGSNGKINTRNLDEDETCTVLLDDLLRSEIKSQMDSIEQHRLNNHDGQDDYQLLKLDPLKFHSI